MAQPKLLLLDEPTLGLSPLMSLQIGQVVSDINAEGIAILLAEQNARLALKVSNEVYVFETGSLKLHGNAKELAADQEIRTAYL
jgi:ABC-type branched-subunit amino acid transport system ATPase component